MTGIVCLECGGDLEEITGGDGMKCYTCGFIIRSDGSHDRSEMYEKENET